VHRLHPIRLLLVSDDRSFCGITSLLLERVGFAVSTTRNGNPATIAELARANRADVVLVDEARSRPRAARMVAALEALCPRARPLVLSTDAGTPSAAAPHEVGRSSTLAELRAAIERCYAGGGSHAAR
jgi:DNA-binding NtrC family response regulator